MPANDLSTLTQSGDVVLIYRDNVPSVFARIEQILVDVKPGWLNVAFCPLIPMAAKVEDDIQTIYNCFTWIIQPEQLDGEEYTMGGTPVRIEAMPEVGTIYNAHLEGLENDDETDDDDYERDDVACGCNENHTCGDHAKAKVIDFKPSGKKSEPSGGAEVIRPKFGK